MSPTADSARAAQVSRRFAIRAGACGLLALVAACGTDRGRDGTALPGSSAGTSTSTSSPPDRDLRLVTDAIADEEQLASFCTAASRRFPDQRAFLDGLAQRQHLHVARFRATLTDLTPPANHARLPLPRRAEDLKPALGALALEARNARSHDCLTATSGLLAELFASVAAAHAVTVQAADPSSAVTTVAFPRAVSTPQALQPCLAAEHAAVFGYGVLGGVLSAAESDAPSAKAALAAYNTHQARRDTLTELLVTAGAEPVAAKAVYDIPFRVAGVPSARRLARGLEASCATVYARATAVTSEKVRLMVSGTLLDCAVRGARWGSAPTAFPGLDAR